MNRDPEAAHPKCRCAHVYRSHEADGGSCRVCACAGYAAKRDWSQVVVDRRERNTRAGRMGAMAQHALYTRADFRKWGRMGGRPRNLTLSELREQQGR